MDVQQTEREFSLLSKKELKLRTRIIIANVTIPIFRVWSEKTWVI